MKSARRFCFGLLATLVLAALSASAQLPPTNAVPNEILVKFRPSLSAKQRSALLAISGARSIRHFETLEIDHVSLPQGSDVRATVAALLASGDVLLAQPNYIRHVNADAPPNDPYWLDNTLWGLIYIQAQPAWQQFGGGDGSVVLAGIDTGVNYNHPDLAANIWTNPEEIPGNGIDDDGNGYIDDIHGIDTHHHNSDPNDDDSEESHGTHTAGTMAAIGDNNLGVVGVSWNAKIIPCKAIDYHGNGDDAAIIECFNYIVALKQRGVNIRASNNSYSGKLGPGDPFPSVLKEAFDAAGAAGILNVCAAGNDSTNDDTDPAYPASFDSPGIMTVAASNYGDNLTYFSNYGASSVDLAAPGLDTMSTMMSGYGHLSGTSMASPHVAGAVAILAQLDPTASVATIKSLLLSNVDLLPQWNGLSVSSGRLNVFKAASAAAASNKPIFVTSLDRPTNETFQITWTAIPGVRYQVFANDSLTSNFVSLSPILTAGAGETSLVFTDLDAAGRHKYYRVYVVP